MNNLKKYLITDPKIYSNNEILFKENLLKALSKNSIDFACFRDKESPNFNSLAKIFVDTCKKENIKNILINGDYKKAKQLNAAGVHLTSTQFDDIKNAKELGLFVIISCHTFEDIKNAKENFVDAVTFSPIFNTPNKGAPKGIEILNEAVNKFEDIKIFALGGIIDENQLKQISKTKAYGFASIRYFV